MEEFSRACIRVVLGKALENSDGMKTTNLVVSMMEDVLVGYIEELGRRASEAAELRGGVAGAEDVIHVLEDEHGWTKNELRRYCEVQDEVPFPRDIPDIPVAAENAGLWECPAADAEIPAHIPRWLPTIPVDELSETKGQVRPREESGSANAKLLTGDFKKLRRAQRNDILDALIELNEDLRTKNSTSGSTAAPSVGFHAPVFTSSASIVSIDPAAPLVGSVHSRMRTDDIINELQQEETNQHRQKLNFRQDDRTEYGRNIARAHMILELTHAEGLQDLVNQPQNV